MNSLFKKSTKKIVNRFFNPKHTMISIAREIEKGLLDGTTSLYKNVKNNHKKKKEGNFEHF